MNNPTASEKSPTPRISIDGITELQQAGRLAEAAAVGDLLLERQPKNPEVAHLVGVVHYQGGDIPAAADHFHKAIELAAQYAPGTYYAYLGDALHKMGKLASAEAAFRRAIEIQPDLAVAHSNLGTVLMASGRASEAIAAFRAAAGLTPTSIEPKLNLGIALLKIEQFADAEQSLREALTIDSQAVVALSVLGVVLSAQKRFDDAEACCREAVSLEPNYALGHTYLGRVFVDQEKFADAQASFEAAIALNSGLADPYIGLAALQRRQNQHDDAVNSSLQACQIAPDNTDAAFCLGLSHMEANNPDAAKEAFSRSIELGSSDLDPGQTRARELIAALEDIGKASPEV